MAAHMEEEQLFRFTRFDPVKYRNVLYGEGIEFNHNKRTVKFTSKFHVPDYLQYDQIERIEIRYDPKKWMLWVGILTLIFFIGLFFVYIKIHLAPWKMTFFLKNGEPLVIRTRSDTAEVVMFQRFCDKHLVMELREK